MKKTRGPCYSPLGVWLHDGLRKRRSLSLSLCPLRHTSTISLIEITLFVVCLFVFVWLCWVGDGKKQRRKKETTRNPCQHREHSGMRVASAGVPLFGELRKTTPHTVRGKKNDVAHAWGRPAATAKLWDMETSTSPHQGNYKHKHCRKNP